MQGRDWKDINVATVLSNSFLGGGNIFKSSLMESTGSFFNLSWNSVSTGNITNFTKAGAVDFGAGFVGNLGGNAFGNMIEWATPGIKEETGKIMGSVFHTTFTFGGEWSGNIVSDKIGDPIGGPNAK
jgi:hypothetical protein